MQVALGKLERVFGWGWLEHQPKRHPCPTHTGFVTLVINPINQPCCQHHRLTLYISLSCTGSRESSLAVCGLYDLALAWLVASGKRKSKSQIPKNCQRSNREKSTHFFGEFLAINSSHFHNMAVLETFFFAKYVSLKTALTQLSSSSSSNSRWIRTWKHIHPGLPEWS